MNLTSNTNNENSGSKTTSINQRILLMKRMALSKQNHFGVIENNFQEQGLTCHNLQKNSNCNTTRSRNSRNVDMTPDSTARLNLTINKESSVKQAYQVPKNRSINVNSLEKRRYNIEIKHDSKNNQTQYEKTIKKLNNIRTNNDNTKQSPYIFSNKAQYINNRRYNMAFGNTLNTLNKKCNNNNEHDKKLNTARQTSESFSNTKIFPKTDRTWRNSKDTMINKQKEFFVNEQNLRYDDKALKKQPDKFRETRHNKFSLTTASFSHQKQTNTNFNKNPDSLKKNNKLAFLMMNPQNPNSTQPTSTKNVQNSASNSNRQLMKLFSYKYSVDSKKEHFKTHGNQFYSRNSSKNSSYSTIKKDSKNITPDKITLGNTRYGAQNWRRNLNVNVNTKNLQQNKTIESRIKKSIINEQRGRVTKKTSQNSLITNLKDSFISKISKMAENNMKCSVISEKSKRPSQTSKESIKTNTNEYLQKDHRQRKNQMEKVLKNSEISLNEPQEILTHRVSKNSLNPNFNATVNFKTNSSTIRKFNKPSACITPKNSFKKEFDLDNRETTERKVRNSHSYLLKKIDSKNSFNHPYMNNSKDKNSSKSFSGHSIHNRTQSNMSVKPSPISRRRDSTASLQSIKNKKILVIPEEKIQKYGSNTVRVLKKKDESQKSESPAIKPRRFTNSNLVLKKKQFSTNIKNKTYQNTTNSITWKHAEKTESSQAVVAEKDYQFDPNNVDESLFVWNFKYQKKIGTQRYFTDDLKQAWIKPDANYFYKEFVNCFTDIFNTFKNLKGYSPLNQKEINDKTIPELQFSSKEKVLFLDLDETLIHTEILQQTVNQRNQNHLLIFTDNKDAKYTYYENAMVKINIRPGLIEFLYEMKQMYTLVLFTSSIKDYADAVIEKFDPGDKFFKHRFYRDQCLKSKNNKLVKDFSVFPNLNLRNCLLVDNSAAHYVNMIDNGVPIINFTDNTEDLELVKLSRYLKSMFQSDRDFREYNSKYFRLEKQMGADSISHGYDLIVT